MKLRVLAGAKQGKEIPLKKTKFVIGRASDCTLRAGSEAISRRHCVLLRGESGVSVRDLGSRNGTYVNEELIEGERVLENGDTIRVGPLKFEFDAGAGLGREKKPKVKDVADAVERAAEISDSATIEEDDISRWLLGPGPSETDAGQSAMRETQTFRMDETHAVGQAKPGGETLNPSDTLQDTPDDDDDDGEEAEDQKGKKKKPGKLPQLPAKPQAKDSCEAAADILRELARRR